jgi:hypothetical protein
MLSLLDNPQSDGGELMDAGKLITDSSNLTIAVFGSSITYSSIGEPTYNPVTGVVTAAKKDYKIKGRMRRFKQDELAANLAQSGDFECVISGDVKFTAKQGDEVKYGGSSYRVINVREHIVADRVTRIRLHVRLV